MIAIGRAGVSGSATRTELSRLRDAFGRRHFVRLPALVRPDLLRYVREKLNRTKFQTISNLGGRDVREVPRDPSAGVCLWMLFNDGRFFDFVRAVTDLDRGLALLGGVYRMRPGPAHRVDWHGDLDGQRRLVAMTVNLSPRPVRGGAFQLRRTASRRLLGEVPYVRAGDALLFRLRADLEHRSTQVEGTSVKTIYACWFIRPRTPSLVPADPRRA